MQAILLLCLAALAFADEDADRRTCLQESDGGMCRAYFEMYYYDYKTRSCKTFVYGGCGGNENRFATEEECLEKCGDVIVFDSESDDTDACDQPKEDGPCYSYFERYYYDKETNKCRRFIYGGCRGNENNFRDKSECEKRCVKEESAAPSLCDEEKVVGPCKARFPRYFFNKESGECEKFFFGGCNGNENNFLTKKECEDICKA